MQIDFTIRLIDIIEFIGFVIVLTALYVKVGRKVATLIAVSDEFTKFRDGINDTLKTFKTEFGAQFELMKQSVTGNVANLYNVVSGLEKRLQDFDEKYVRKDVHDADLRLIKEQLRPLERIEKFIDKFIELPSRKTRKK